MRESLGKFVKRTHARAFWCIDVSSGAHVLFNKSMKRAVLTDTRHKETTRRCVCTAERAPVLYPGLPRQQCCSFIRRTNASRWKGERTRRTRARGANSADEEIFQKFSTHTHKTSAAHKKSLYRTAFSLLFAIKAFFISRKYNIYIYTTRGRVVPLWYEAPCINLISCVFLLALTYLFVRTFLSVKIHSYFLFFPLPVQLSLSLFCSEKENSSRRMEVIRKKPFVDVESVF